MVDCACQCEQKICQLGEVLQYGQAARRGVSSASLQGQPKIP